MDIDRIPVAKAFLCHSSSDKPFVRRVGAHLRKHNLTIWLDEREIRAGDSLIDRISEGLSAADYLLVFLSQQSVKSNWVKKELNTALMKKLQANDVEIIPVLVENCALPILLLEYKYVDFRQTFEQGISELIDTLRPPFPVDLSDHPLIDPDELIDHEDLISQDMTQILRLIQDYGLNDPNAETAQENVRKFQKWYESNRDSMIASGDPRVGDFDYIYWFSTGATVDGDKGSKPEPRVVKREAKPRHPARTSEHSTFQGKDEGLSSARKARSKRSDSPPSNRSKSSQSMWIRPYGGRTKIVVLPDLQVIVIENDPPEDVSPQVLVYDFDGNPAKLPSNVDVIQTSPHRKRIFEFEGPMALVQANHQMCDNEAIEEGVIIGIDTEKGHYLFRPLYASLGCTIGYIDIEVVRSTKDAWGFNLDDLIR